MKCNCCYTFQSQNSCFVISRSNYAESSFSYLWPCEKVSDWWSLVHHLCMFKSSQGQIISSDRVFQLAYRMSLVLQGCLLVTEITVRGLLHSSWRKLAVATATLNQNQSVTSIFNIYPPRPLIVAPRKRTWRYCHGFWPCVLAFWLTISFRIISQTLSKVLTSNLKCLFRLKITREQVIRQKYIAHFF